MGLYISASGILHALLRQRVTADNIANLSTPGFGAGRVHSAPDESGGVRANAILHDFTPGPLPYTGRSLDIAAGNAFFRVELADGGFAFTRDGAFGLNANGEVVTMSGGRLSPPVQVSANATGVTVARDGSIYATVPDSLEPQLLGHIQVYAFANPDGLERVGDNLYRATASSGEGQPITAATQMETGALEGSNVELGRELADVTLNTRFLQANVNAFRAQAELLGTLLDIDG